ncbi:MAG: hypothetical protein V1790_03970 [Planctomycetota bacterium]
MFKVRRFVCLALVCALVGVAYAGATKIRSFTTFNEPEDADGMAILNVADSQGLVIQIIVSGFTPNTLYAPFLFDPCSGSEYYVLDYFTTDDRGNGRFHRDVGTLYPWPNIRLYVCPAFDTNGQCIWELRAQGDIVCP